MSHSVPGPVQPSPFVDLHVHTSHSDGRLAPAEMVREAAARGLASIAVVDHDVVTGLPAAIDEGKRLGLEVVPGIEMTARWEGRAVHVLGYFVDAHDLALNEALARARSLMASHVDEVLAEIARLGFELRLDHLDQYRHRYAGGAALVMGMVQRGVLARAPAGTGWRLLRTAAAEPRAYDLAEAVALIHGAGGVASLAHPSRLRRSEPLLSADDLRALAGTGLDAIEAWQWIPGGWGSDHYRQVAGELGLLVSGGSDDHGKQAANGQMRLGSQRVPVPVLECLRARARDWQARRSAPPPG